MINLLKDCTFITLHEEDTISDFDCGNWELNDFFNNKALPTSVAS